MNILYFAWAGYDFRGDPDAVAVCHPSLYSEEVGNKNLKAEVTISSIGINATILKPSLVAFPNPVG